MHHILTQNNLNGKHYLLIKCCSLSGLIQACTIPSQQLQFSVP